MDRRGPLGRGVHRTPGPRCCWRMDGTGHGTARGCGTPLSPHLRAVPPGSHLGDGGTGVPASSHPLPPALPSRRAPTSADITISLFIHLFIHL